MSQELVQGQKYIWTQPTIDASERLYVLAQRYTISASVMAVLLNRGITTEEDIERFLMLSYDREVHDARLLKDAERAVTRIEEAIAGQEKILIAGDYDVDGVTSSALLLRCLAPLGAQINFFLPHRQRDGYGLSTTTIRRAKANGYGLIITVDNGITAYEPIREARHLGIDVIITDHHKPHEKLPDAYAIVNPHQQDCVYPFKYFAGVGVGFKLMSLLYERRGISLPTVVYELLMLGTIADVVPLVGENRFWVQYGLRCANDNESLPLRVLKNNARFTKPRLSSLDVGFYMAPQINALGRLDDARAAVAFLLGSDEMETERIGALLGNCNTERKQIEQDIVKQIIETIRTQDAWLQYGVIVVADHGWQPGVVGLVAARLVGLYHRPAIVLHITETGIAKGSCRSIPEINIFDALQTVRDILHTFGGHPMAAGVSLSVDQVDILREQLHMYVTARIPIADLKQRIHLDASVTLSDVTKQLMADIRRLEPFGAGNREPLFYLKQVSIIGEPQLLKDLHVKCMLFSDGVLKPAIFFNRPELYSFLCHHREKPFSLAMSISENYWNGKTSIELTGIDVAQVP